MERNDPVQKFKDAECLSDDLHISSEEDRKYAITKAYHDLMVRTIPGHTPSVQENCISHFAGQLKQFVEIKFRSQEEYIAEHKKLCNGFLTELNKQLDEVGAKQQSFGKAQKAVNMTLKYLYCFCDRKDFEALFKYAHMPIDTYIMNWCRSNSLLPRKNYAWSNLTEDEYYEIAGRITVFLKTAQSYGQTALPSSPLEADFIIWPREKCKAAVDELKSVLKKLGKDSDLIHCITAEDKKEIREYFEKIIPDSEE